METGGADVCTEDVCTAGAEFSECGGAAGCCGDEEYPLLIDRIVCVFCAWLTFCWLMERTVLLVSGADEFIGIFTIVNHSVFH